MNRKGFTLVELLVVIIILLAIMVIALPSISGTLDKSKTKDKERAKELIESAALMYANDNIHLIATIFPNNASIKDLEWSSSDYSIASVDQNGNVHAVGDGTATITAYSTDGSGKFASCTVTVRSYVESLSLNQCTASLYPNESIQLEAQILPNYAYNQTLRWNSSNTSVATVSSEGLVICKNPGFV